MFTIIHHCSVTFITMLTKLTLYPQLSHFTVVYSLEGESRTSYIDASNSSSSVFMVSNWR